MQTGAIKSRDCLNICIIAKKVFIVNMVPYCSSLYLEITLLSIRSITE